MATESEIEELQLELEAKVCGLDVDALGQLAEHLTLEKGKLGRLQLSKRVREKIEVDVSEAEDKKTLLVGLLAFVQGKPPPLEDDTTTETKVKVEPPTPTEKAQGEETKVNVDVSKVLRREFKIHGVVAGDNFKDGLSFVSLARQIESGTKAGYKESEIVEAVIRAVSPSLQLRSYLEMIQDLSLSRLKQIMKAHFKQKSATELYQELSVLRQEASESPQSFLVRALNLKQQIIFVSNATEDSIKYEPSLVQALFLHVVETGLQDESVRAKLRPLLEVASVTDEQLMERVNRIMSAETEHQNKMGAVGRKGARVNQVETASPSSNQTQPSSSPPPQGESSKSQKKEPKPNTLVTALEAVQSNLASLKESFDRVSAPVERSPSRNYASGNRSQFQRRQCSSCRAAGVDNCDHCFKCGSTDHFARGCRRVPGNGRRLHQRDRV